MICQKITVIKTYSISKIFLKFWDLMIIQKTIS